MKRELITCDVAGCSATVVPWSGGSSIKLEMKTPPGWTGQGVLNADICKEHLEKLLDDMKACGLELAADV